ncbi:unnamed protein product [Dicrocoelium dendriticum]|nr:unnamed protein product [Dicrocoelium dendriticum]
MGLPPCESAESSRRVFSVSNPFGGGPVGAPAAAQDTKMQRLLTTTQAGADAMLVLLGETCLDRPDCLDRLTTLFNGYCDCPPVAFVLTGNFLGPSANGRSYPERVSSLRQLLIQLIMVYKNAFPDIDTLSPSRCPHLILVPGPTDPVCAPSSILPRPGFPFRLFSDILDGRRVGNDAAVKCPPWLHLTSNPCRLRLYTREIVVFRAEYSRLLIRHCIHLPAFSEPLDDAVTSIDLQQDSETQLPESQRSGDENTPTDDNSSTSVRAPKPKTPAERLGAGLARCLASQAHLLPLMGHIAPVYWAFDQALSLQPLPDLVVAVEPQSLADLNSTTANPIQTGNCRFINPDQFGRTVLAESTGLRTEYAFKVYYPLTGVVENSRLPD